ncbi:phytase [Altererythrobacter sp. Root672]|uniref:phytase n=1 Tax=Altererythrobacter sp. Root672 TaxID=1736584 RepID=UPI0006FD5F8F|nr:phytase [Altererythrobacter sp. Root672]KRA82666.1 3-phytase [Altererythrobacter sp. Root672]
MRTLAITLATASFALAGCASNPVGLPAVEVTAVAETDPVGTANEDAADDPAIWRNAADPAASLIVATDKKSGLLVYDLSGKTRFTDNSGLLNNVDLATMPDGRVIVVASDRNDPANAKLRLWRLDTAKARLEPLGAVSGGTGEAYGVCLWRNGDSLIAYSVLKEGVTHEVRIKLNGTPTGEPLRTMKLSTQTEGCVVDPSDGTLYVGEEDVGIWKFAPGATEGKLVAPVDNQHLVADVEGLALLRTGDRAVLVASSQGDNAYAVFALPDMTPLGRFRIVAGKFGSTEETDGIELAGGSFGADYPDGLFIAQDGHNQPAAQNFKLVSWAAVKAALGLN